MMMRLGPVALICATITLALTACAPPTDPLPALTQASPNPLTPEAPETPRQQLSKETNEKPEDIASRVRELQFQIEEKTAELRLLQKKLSDLKELQQAQRSIAPASTETTRRSDNQTPNSATKGTQTFGPRDFPPRLPEPALSADRLIEEMLDDVDLVLAKLRSGKLVEQAKKVEQLVTDVRSRSRDAEARFEALGERELHVVGLYEGIEFETGKQRAEVHVTYTAAPMVLCLTSHEKIHWTIRVEPGAKLDSIVLGGSMQFLRNPPDGVPVVDCTEMNAGTRPVPAAYSRQSTDSSAPGFPMLAKQLMEVTGLEVTTFQGHYRFPGTPIVVGPGSDLWRQERVLADLRRIHTKAMLPDRLQQWHRMKALKFEAVHYRFASSDPRRRGRSERPTGSIGPFTPLGPDLDQHKPFPADVNCPVYDAIGSQFYGLAGHGLVQVNQLGAKHLDLVPPKDFPEVSWPCGLAFDSKRQKVVMVTLGGTGYMYGYEPATQQWTIMADMKEAGLVPFVYLPQQDEFLGLQVEHGGTNFLYRYDHAGKFLSKKRLAQSLLNSGAKHSYCQAIPVEDLVVFLIGAEQLTPEGNPTVRAFVVDPRSGEVVFSMLHDDETLRAAANANVPEAPAWIKADVTPPAPADAVGKEPVSPRPAEAVLAVLRREGSRGVEQAPELHVIGFYEPAPRHSGPEDQAAVIDVCIKPSSKPIVVALTAYESAHWQLTFETGANVAAVILSGYHSQSAEGVPAEVPVIKMSSDDGSQNYFYCFDETRGEYREMLTRLRTATGLEVLTFQGSYTPLADTIYRIRPAVPGDYKAARNRLANAAK